MLEKFDILMAYPIHGQPFAALWSSHHNWMSAASLRRAIERANTMEEICVLVPTSVDQKVGQDAARAICQHVMDRSVLEEELS